MSDTVTVHAGELAYLEVRAKRLAREKSYLQLVMRLINKVSGASGLEETVDCVMRNILDVVGGTNIVLYYWIDGQLFSTDVYGNKLQPGTIDDELVQKALATREPVELEHNFSDTQMITSEFGSAYTWVYPLLVGDDLIGVFKMENLHIGMRDLYGQLPTFFKYVAMVLKNEILGHTRLQQAYNQLREMNETLEAKNTELKRMNKMFVGRELRMMELKEQVRALEEQVAAASYRKDA